MPRGLPPLIVAADQEGGIVSHLAPPLTRLPALSTLAALAPERRTEAGGRVRAGSTGRNSPALGVTLNFAPVLDLRPRGKAQPARFQHADRPARDLDRSGVVSATALPYVRGLAASGVGATVKHFPGLGRVSADTHHFSADLDTPVEELEASDWLPFKDVLAGSKAQLMVGHVTLRALDPDRAGFAFPAHRRRSHPQAMALSGRRHHRRSGHGRDLSA